MIVNHTFNFERLNGSTRSVRFRDSEGVSWDIIPYWEMGGFIGFYALLNIITTYFTGVAGAYPIDLEEIRQEFLQNEC